MFRSRDRTTSSALSAVTTTMTRREPDADEVARPAPVRAFRHDAEDGGRPLAGRDRRQDAEIRSPLRDRHPISLVEFTDLRTSIGRAPATLGRGGLTPQRRPQSSLG